MKIRFLLIILAMLSPFCMLAQEQSPEQPRTPEIMSTATLGEQLEYIRQRSNVYNNYRAIREDIFNSLKNNTLDTLNAIKATIQDLEKSMNIIKKEQDSINTILQKTQEELEYAIKTRNKLFFFGIPVNKIIYNIIMWSALIGLAAVSVMVLMLYLRNRGMMIQSRKELVETQDEFESYRKTTREKIEKLIVDHFNEIKKLKR